MPKWIVGIREVYVNNVIVSAETKEDAIEKVSDADYEAINLEYSHTLDSETWTVEKYTVEKYIELDFV